MLSIDLAYLRRHDLLQPGKVSTLSWSQHGQQTGSIRIIAQAEGVGLSYRTTGPDGTPRDVLEAVPFLHTATKFGGRRAWFQCLACKRRSNQNARQRGSEGPQAVACGAFQD